MGKLLIFGALISDFDGTIFDTQKYHARVESKILKDFGINVSPADITRKYAGVSTRKMFQDFLGDTLKNGSLDELVRRKFDLLSEIVDSVDISEIEIPHALDTILSIYERGYKLAIATASNRVYVEKILSRSRISHCFKTKQGPVKILRPEIYDLVVTGEDVDRGKPAPDIFLRAAEILGVYPGSCAVVEDGLAGMQAGTSAGMYVFGLSGSDVSDHDNDVRENSSLLVRSWKTVDLFFKSGPHISSVSDIVKYERKSTR